MTKAEIVSLLEEIGVLLEIKGENPFKCRAYASAARALEAQAEEPSVLVEQNLLAGVPGIGQALQEKITTLVRTGRLPFYEELKASFPPGLPGLLRIPGLGAKKIKTLHERLGIGSVEELEASCLKGQVAALAGFGAKTQANLLAGIAQRRAFSGYHRLGDLWELAEELAETLRQHPDVLRVSLAGSLRRGSPVVKDIDLLASSSHPERVQDFFVHLEPVIRIVNHGPTKSSILLEGGIPADLRVVPDRAFGTALHHFTGSKEHNILMRQRAIARGLHLSEWGLFPEAATPLPIGTEEELFAALDLDFIPAELREGLDELEAAETGKIPRLVEWTHLRGCLHNHTTASDGKNTLEEMAAAARDLGLEYLGIADHSKSSFQANGLSEERLLAQVEEIRAWNQEHASKGLTLLAGTECDILKDGTLDYSDEILEQLDYVAASVHSSFQLDAAAMTRRLIRAMEHPCVTLIAHPSGRLLLEREAYALDHAALIDAAARTGTWLELNANPWRLDMDWKHWKRARDLGVKCALNPDAHAVRQLGYLRLGVLSARKGWLRREDVVNCLPLAKLRPLLKKKGA